MKKKLLLLLALAVVVAGVNSCSTDPDYPENDPSGDSGNWRDLVTRAQNYFEAVYSPDLKTRTAQHSPAVAALSSMEVNPDWERSLYSEDEHAAYLEFPLLSEKRYGTGNQDAVRTADRRLVVRKDRQTGELSLYTSLWMPADAVSENQMSGLTLVDIGDFSGNVFLFYPDGQFYYGVRFLNGQHGGSVNLREVNTAYSGLTRGGGCETFFEGYWEQWCWYSSNHELISCDAWTLHILFEYDVCDWDSEDTGENDGGGGGGTDSQTQIKEPEDPCQNMKNKMNSPAFKNMLNDLSNLTSSNYEAGRAYKYTSNGYSFTTHNGNPGEPRIVWEPAPGENLSGFVHSHYDGVLPVFSASDLLVPGYWNELGGVYDLKTFSLGVVTSEGTFFIQITDIQSYQNFYNMFSADPMTMDILENWYENTYGIKTGMSANNAANALAKLLEDINSGLTLMQKNGNEFNKFQVNSNGQVQNNPC